MSGKHQLDQKGDFQSVEISELGNTNSAYYIESAKSLKSTIFFLIAFIAIHIFASWKAPPLLIYEEIYYPFNKTSGSATVDFNITLSSLTSYHKTVNINGSLVRDLDKSIDQLKVPSTVTVSAFFEYESTSVESLSGKPIKYELAFDPIETKTQPFPILSHNISDFDTIKLRISIDLNVTYIEGISISWSYSNLSAGKYSRAARILASFLTAYMLVIFVTFMNLNAEKFTQILIIVVGASGFLSSNPLAIFLPSSNSLLLADHVLNYFFLCSYRLLLLSQLEIIRRQSSSPMIITAIVFVLFFLCYTVLGAFAGYERANYIIESVVPEDKIFQSETILMYFDIAYGVLALIWIIAALIQGRQFAPARLYLVIFLIVLSLASTIVSDIVLPKLNYMMFTIFPSMIVSSTHLNSAAFCIFLMHNGSDSLYSEIGKNKQAGVSLDVEELSSDNDQFKHDDEDDDEEEEEEEE